MDFGDGYHDLPRGKVAAVQTFLEMRERPALLPEPAALGVTLRHVEMPDMDWYLRLFHRVGDRWLWFARLMMPRDELHTLITDPREEVYVVEHNGSEEGLLELDFRTRAECEIAYLGLTDGLVGTGAGRWLMNRAIEIAWAKPISRFWVHTCSLDHPKALDYYIRSGFVPYDRKIEIAGDPRLLGLIPRNAAPQIPLIEPIVRKG
jgi:GNAT superfamily N-acetyltransferase